MCVILTLIFNCNLLRCGHFFAFMLTNKSRNERFGFIHRLQRQIESRVDVHPTCIPACKHDFQWKNMLIYMQWCPNPSRRPIPVHDTVGRNGVVEKKKSQTTCFCFINNLIVKFYFGKLLETWLSDSFLMHVKSLGHVLKMHPLLSKSGYANHQI